MTIPIHRIFLSAPIDANLNLEQLSMKRELLDALVREGFEIQEFLTSGLPEATAWSFKEANQVMSRCQGAVILALARWYMEPFALASEYNHFEGALALAQNIPTLIIQEQYVRDAGILQRNPLPIVSWSPSQGPTWMHDTSFARQFKAWSSKVKARPDVFLGYCSRAKATATDIARFLERQLHLNVHEYSMDFLAGVSIIDQIEEAAQDCMCGVFLFTQDDQLAGDIGNAAPRDNVIFEAGYFMHARGKERVVIIREEGVKMPADIGGISYIPLKDRNDISTIHTKLRQFLEKQL